MARTLKNFNTEAEYEEWINSPYMRTPYTCLVKETGNVHYFDGDDDDYSITFVARRHAWVRLWSQSIFKTGLDGKKFNPKVYINGERVGNFDNRWENKYHYRAFLRRDEDFNPITNDFGYYHQMFGDAETAFKRDSYLIPNPVNGEVNLLYHRKHVFRNKRNPQRCSIFLNPGDILKIVVDRPSILLHEIGGANSHLNNLRPPVQVHLFDITQIFRYGEYAKEIIIGDGFDRIPRITRIRKLFLGKNNGENTDIKATGKYSSKSKIYSRKRLEHFNNDMRFLKNVYPDIY